MTEREKREYERQKQLQELQQLVYEFEAKHQDTDHCGGHMLLLRAFIMEVNMERVPADDDSNLFVRLKLMQRLREFSATPIELFFMQAKMLEFFVGGIQDEVAHALACQELLFPETIFGEGKAGTSPVTDQLDVAEALWPGGAD